MSAALLLARVREYGFRVDLDDTGPYLVRVTGGAILPTGVLAELKRHRDVVVAFVTCRACGRVTCDEEDRQRLVVANPFCDLAKCPYRQQER